MPVSGHETLKEVERYTKSANRLRLANNAIAALKTAQKEGAELEKRDSKLVNMAGTVSQSSIQAPVLKQKIGDGGEGVRHDISSFSMLCRSRLLDPTIVPSHGTQLNLMHSYLSTQ
jgi:hypothetical protein